MPDEIQPEIPDLKSLLVEASRPWAEVTVPLKQGIRSEIKALEAELAQLAADAPAKRMGAESPLKAKAREIEAKRAEMKASERTFRFEPLTAAKREQVRKGMRGRDDNDEFHLRLMAARCVSMKATWEDFRDLRDTLGVEIFSDIEECEQIVGDGQWSVPFSLSASHILGTEK